MRKRELEAKLKALNKQRFDIHHQIEDLKNRRELPAIKKKLEGKFFTYTNSYNSEDRWLKYSYVRKVLSCSEILIDTFEMDSNGEFSFWLDYRHNVFLCEKEITKSEYDNKLSEMLSEVLRMRSNVFNQE